MSDTPNSTNDPLRFTSSEIDQLGRTADTLSAWMGKPVLAQVIDAAETGFEWVIFAVPLLPEQDVDDLTVVQIGGPDAHIIGNKGGLELTKNELYDCEYLWAVQLSDTPGVRYIKIDTDGDDVAWTQDLNEILPFDLNDPQWGDLDDGDPSDDPHSA